MPTIKDIQQGENMAELDPQRTQPAQQEWWNVNSGLSLNTFGYPDNFDNSYPYLLYFYIDEDVKSILKVGLTLKFQKFRGYTKPLSHDHEVTIPNHTHTVSIPSHTHSISSRTTSTSGTGTSAHQHTIFVQSTTSSVATLEGYGYKHLMVQPGGGGSAGPCDDNSDIGKVWAADSSNSNNDVTFKTNCTISGHHHTIYSTATNSGGSSTPTSSSGGGSTQTSDATAGAEYGVFEDTYPSNISLELDGVDITSQLGGAWNPDATTNLYTNLDLTPFVTEGGLHTLQLTTDTRGRALPLLHVKSIIGR